jgi:hypothetical protein
VTVDDSGTAWTAHLVRDDDGGLSVTRMEPRTFSTIGSQPVWPPTGRESPERTASRLAELIRRDPSLLDPPREPPR